MDEDLLVLLIPSLERVPVEAGRAGDPADRVVTEHLHGPRPVQAARAQAMAARGAAAQVLLVVLVDDEARIDVLGRDVVLRVVLPFQYVPRAGRVEDLLAAQRRPYPPRRRLDPVGLYDHLRVIAAGRDR